MGFDYRAAREQVFGSDLPPLLRLVLLAMVEHMPDCRPSVSHLASRVGVERKTVMRAVERLERRGALRVERRNGAPNRYHLLGPVPQEGPVPGNGTDPVPCEGPVPEWDQSHLGNQPVPFQTQTGPILELTSPTVGTQSRKQKKQKKREPDSGKPRRRKQQLPDGFEPGPGCLKLATELGVDLDGELPQFRDHHLKMGSLFLDWQAALRTWIRNAKRFNGGRINGSPAGGPVLEPTARHRAFAEAHGVDLGSAVKRLTASPTFHERSVQDAHQMLGRELARMARERQAMPDQPKGTR